VEAVATQPVQNIEKGFDMYEMTAHSAQAGEPKVTTVRMLADADRTMVDRVMFGETPAHLIVEDPFGATLGRRIAQDVFVRDYLATFARTTEGARRVLGLALALARAADAAQDRRASVSGVEVAGWCALSLGRWELADALALRAQGTSSASGLSELIRRIVAARWMAEVIGIEPEVCVEDVRACASVTLRRLTSPHTFVSLD
jgi:hypothetical protein